MVDPSTSDENPTDNPTENEETENDELPPLSLWQKFKRLLASSPVEDMLFPYVSFCFLTSVFFVLVHSLHYDEYKLGLKVQNDEWSNEEQATEKQLEWANPGPSSTRQVAMKCQYYEIGINYTDQSNWLFNVMTGWRGVLQTSRMCVCFYFFELVFEERKLVFGVGNDGLDGLGLEGGGVATEFPAIDGDWIRWHGRRGCVALCGCASVVSTHGGFSCLYFSGSV